MVNLLHESNAETGGEVTILFWLLVLLGFMLYTTVAKEIDWGYFYLALSIVLSVAVVWVLL